MAARLGPTIDERRGVEYHELRSESLIGKLNARPMPFGWTVNPYRGCEMGCHYCFARYTHEFLGLGDPDAFERTIYVKEIDRSRLLQDLKKARKSGQTVALGTATDPYQPAEGRFDVTRRILEAAREVPGLRLSITTKSTLVARDAELLRAIAGASEVTVNLSITTADPALARRLEPRVPRPDLRFGAMRTLADAAVATRLFIMPILPGLTDHEANLKTLLAAARDAGAGEAESNVSLPAIRHARDVHAVSRDRVPAARSRVRAALPGLGLRAARLRARGGAACAAPRRRGRAERTAPRRSSGSVCAATAQPGLVAAQKSVSCALGSSGAGGRRPSNSAKARKRSQISRTFAW
jgi:DNA repair photolyase